MEDSLNCETIVTVIIVDITIIIIVLLLITFLNKFSKIVL